MPQYFLETSPFYELRYHLKILQYYLHLLLDTKERSIGRQNN